MAKKKQSKKHRFKYTEPTVAAGLALGGGRPDAMTADADLASAKAAPGRPVVGARDFGYVGIDVRRIAVLAGSLVVLEIALWYLFSHTSVGAAVYNWFSVS